MSTKSIAAEGFSLPARVDGYAFYGTWSVVDVKGRICLPILGPEGERPDDAEQIAQMVADAINFRAAQKELPL